MNCRKCGASETHLYRDDDNSIACYVCGHRNYGIVCDKVEQEERSGENDQWLLELNERARKQCREDGIGRGEGVANFIEPETKEKIEALLREGRGIREVSRLTGAASNTVAGILKSMSDGEELKCKCGLSLTHRGRCGARRLITKEIAEKPLKKVEIKPKDLSFDDPIPQEIPVTIRLTIDVNFRVNGVAA